MTAPLACALLLLAAPAAAATIRDLLMQALERPDEIAAAELDGMLADEISRLHPQLRVYGEARQLHELDEPGCGRFEVRLHAAADGERIEMGTVELDLCEGGLPPVPPGARP